MNMKKIKEYLDKEVSIIVNLLFEKLKENNINVELERTDLNNQELKIYMSIYNEYKENLIKLKDKVILEFGYIDNFDYLFATVIQNVVNRKQEGFLK